MLTNLLFTLERIPIANVFMNLEIATVFFHKSCLDQQDHFFLLNF